MNNNVTMDTVARWEREDAEVKAGIKLEAAEKAISFANSSDFTVELRRKARSLDVIDFFEGGDSAMSAKLVAGDPDFGDLLVELLTDRDLIGKDDEYLSPEAEAFVDGFFETLSKCLDEYDGRSGKK